MRSDLKDDHGENQAVSDYLEAFGKAVRKGQARLPDPEGEFRSPEAICAAWEAVGDSSKMDTIESPQLLKTAIQAEATGFRPWEGEEPLRPQRVPTARRRTIRYAAAAAVLFAVGVGAFQWAAGRRALRSMETAMVLRVGFADFESGVRGVGGFEPGSKPNVFFTMTQPGFFSILLLDGQCNLTVERANEMTDAGRQQVEWRIPQEVIAETTETVFVMVSTQRLENLDELIKIDVTDCAPARAACIDRVVRGAREQFRAAVGHSTYSTAPAP